MRREKGPRALRLIAVLLALAALCAALSSCDLLLGGVLGDRGNTSTTTAATTTRRPAPPITGPVAFDQYLSPDIPDDAGTYVYVAEVATPSVVSIETGSGAGSGVVCWVDAEAGATYIVTNNHVVEGYSTVGVYKSDSDTEYAAAVQGTDWQTDIAVLRIESTDFVPAQLGNSAELLVGQEVAAIGNPLGILGGSITPGIIGALARQIEVEGVPMTLVQHSAPVSPGNSGGGLFNLYGQLIGIVNAKSTGSGVEGLGYAIPIDLALERAGEIIDKGYVPGTPSLGITYSGSTGSIVVSSYSYNSELTASGQTNLAEGDVLVSLGGEAVGGIADVRRVLSGKNIGDRVTATFQRAAGYFYNQSFTVELVVHEYIPAWAQ